MGISESTFASVSTPGPTRCKTGRISSDTGSLLGKLTAILSQEPDKDLTSTVTLKMIEKTDSSPLSGEHFLSAANKESQTFAGVSFPVLPVNRIEATMASNTHLTGDQ